MSADWLSKAKIAWVVAWLCGVAAAALVFYLGYTNAAAAEGIMPERCLYRIFCYTISLPAVAALRILPVDDWCLRFFSIFADLRVKVGSISSSALICIVVRSLTAGAFYVLLMRLVQIGWARGQELRRQGQLVWNSRCALFLIVVITLLLSTIAYLRKDVGVYRVCAYKLNLKGLPQGLEGLRLVFFSDLHVGTYSRQSDITRAADLINRLKPDIVVGGGDYVFGSQDRFARAAAWLRLLQPHLALIGVLGNHDYWHGSREAEKACAEGGLQLLNNERLFINEYREVVSSLPQRGLCLAGVGDLWSSSVDISQALEGVREDMPRLLFSHNPDVIFERYGGKERLDFILSGHTHGGQVLLPWGTPLGISTKYPRELIAGWYKTKNCQVYTNVGLGETVVPFRCGVKPEITLFILSSGPVSSAEELSKY